MTMNENDKQAEPVGNPDCWRCGGDGCSWCKETHPAQPVQPAAQGDPVKFAKYFALTDAEGKYIKKDYFSGQLEIYEEENQVPCSHKETSTIAVYVTKTPTSAAAINEQLLEALRLIRGKHGCGALTLPQADLERTNAAIAAAEAEKAKGGV